jgi:hypothetical protein
VLRARSWIFSSPTSARTSDCRLYCLNDRCIIASAISASKRFTQMPLEKDMRYERWCDRLDVRPDRLIVDQARRRKGRLCLPAELFDATYIYSLVRLKTPFSEASIMPSRTRSYFSNHRRALCSRKLDGEVS